MAKRELDIKQIKKLPIDKVVPNGWNPKEKDTKEYQKVRDSIKTKGLLGLILVRQHPYQENYWEIVDGEQRWTAASELGYKEIPVYDAGQVDEKDAKELTIWFQQQVPFSRVTEAYLVTELVSEFGINEVEIPYTEAEIADLSNLADFNFDSYGDQTNNNDGGGGNIDGTATFSVKLPQTDYDIVVGALGQYASEHGGIDVANALVMVCTELRIDQGGDEQEL